MGVTLRTGVALTLASAGLAIATAAPLSANAQSGAEKVLVVCTATEQGMSKNCRFDYDIDDEVDRLKAGTELGYLDNHPFPLPGASVGADVKVLVRLNVSVAPDRHGFVVSSPGNAPLRAEPVITDPQWTLPPNGHWADQYIPEQAARTNETGGAVVVCIAEASGDLGDCWVQSQTPADAGFGDAALRILKRARMKSLTASQTAVAGRPYVHIFKYAGWGPEAPVGAFEPRWAP